MAATDPVRKITEHEIEQHLTIESRSRLKRLAALPPATETPYLTLTLDWRPDGYKPEMRSGKFFFDQQMDEFLESTGFHPHTPQFESLHADIAAARAFLEGDIDPAVQGIVIFACSARNVFEPVSLGLPLDNTIELGPTPALRVLAKVLEDEPRFVALAADQEHASLIVVDQAVGLYELNVEATGYPRRQSQGGWSQRRYQMRADERVEAFARTVAEKTKEVMQESGAEHLVLVGDEQSTSLLQADLHPTVQSRIAGVTKVDRLENDPQVISAALPVIEEAERRAEAQAVGQLENGAGPGGGAVVGVEATLAALQAQQVMTLVMNDDFSAAGWADFSLPIYGVGEPPGEHPAGGDTSAIVRERLDDELVRLALLEDAEIEIIHTRPPVTDNESVNDVDGHAPRTRVARRLDELGGVGAILRFTLADDQSTANLSSR
jgi:hypothetical protein